VLWSWLDGEKKNSIGTCRDTLRGEDPEVSRKIGVLETGVCPLPI
jgi:hypothetical protein